jgi:hypothetical protein
MQYYHQLQYPAQNASCTAVSSSFTIKRVVARFSPDIYQLKSELASLPSLSIQWCSKNRITSIKCPLEREGMGGNHPGVANSNFEIQLSSLSSM